MVKNIKMMILLADGGSTKVDWVLRDGDVRIGRYTTKGLNPVHVAEHDIEKVLVDLVREHPEMLHVGAIEFYGSGCLPSSAPKMEGCLRRIFGDNMNIVVGSDIIGAAKAVCGENEGIACILGTGQTLACGVGGRCSRKHRPSAMSLVMKARAPCLAGCS